MRVNQPSAMPTRKLTAATLTGAIMAAAGLFVRNLWPDWYDETLWLALTPLVSAFVGYYVKDEPNVVPEFTGTDQ